MTPDQPNKNTAGGPLGPGNGTPPGVLTTSVVLAVVALCIYAVVVPGANVAALAVVGGILTALALLVSALRGRGHDDSGSGSGPT